MAVNSKARHLEIYAAAAAIVEAAGGTEKIDSLPPDERRAFYRDAHKDVMKATNCGIDAAKRNVAKAMRKGRYAEMVARWGGQREGSGYPKGVPRKKEIGTMNEKIETIEILYSDDAMWGNAPDATDGVDIRASYAKFEQDVTTRLRELYPSAAVEFDHGINDGYRVNGYTDHEEMPTVENAVGAIWQEFDWIVRE